MQNSFESAEGVSTPRETGFGSGVSLQGKTYPASNTDQGSASWLTLLKEAEEARERQQPAGLHASTEARYWTLYCKVSTAKAIAIVSRPSVRLARAAYKHGLYRTFRDIDPADTLALLSIRRHKGV